MLIMMDFDKTFLLMFYDSNFILKIACKNRLKIIWNFAYTLS